MYIEGDFVIYGNQSVCRIEKVGVINLGNTANKREYYTLVPIFINGKTYAPVDAKGYMRHLITKEEVHSLISSMASLQAVELDNFNKRELTEYYKDVIHEYSCSDLLQVICNIDALKELRELQGKKLGQTDTNVKRQAEDLLYQEFSVVLGIAKDKVMEYIRIL